MSNKLDRSYQAQLERNTGKKAKKENRRARAMARKENKVSPEKQLERLAKRPGEAKRERTKLEKLIAA